MRFCFKNPIKFLLNPRFFLGRNQTVFVDFHHSSSLKLSTFLKKLMEPVETNKSVYEKIELGLHEALINAVKQ